MIDAYEVILVF